jgi:uncharacterized protein (TIGR01777 family)
METIVIAGGSGLIGKQLTVRLRQEGHIVRWLTRGAANSAQQLFHWNPEKKEMDSAALEGVTVLINLTGEGIAEKRWTKNRIDRLYRSRIESTHFLWEVAKNNSTLKHYISASGAMCFGFDDPNKKYNEEAPYGTDLLSKITEKWEESAAVFEQKCTVTIVRISVVLAKEAGALKSIAQPIKYGVGAIIGSGKQVIPWISLDDLTAVFSFMIANEYGGTFHANAGNTTNSELTKTIARVLKKPLLLPKVPAWLMYCLFGKMAVVVVNGVMVDNHKLLAMGFEFSDPTVELALKKIYL